MRTSDDFIVLDPKTHKRCEAIAEFTMASLCTLADEIGLSRNDIICGFADIFDQMVDTIDYDCDSSLFFQDEEGGAVT